MPSPAPCTPRRRDARAEYYYRRELGLRELIPAIGVAIGAGLFAFYITRLLLERTPLHVEHGRGPASTRAEPARRPRVDRARFGNPAA